MSRRSSTLSSRALSRSRTRALLAAVAVSSAAWGLLQCHKYSDAPAAPPPPITDAGDAGDAATQPAGDGCNHALPPAAPTTDDAPGVSNDFWLAFDTLDFPVVTDGGVHLGFDLDNTCTCIGTDHDGAAPCDTPATVRKTCDFDGGVDDGVGATIAASFGQYLNGSQAAYVAGLLAGGGATELVHISGYNGAANDPDVKVALLPAGGLLTTTGCDGGARPLKPTQETLPDGGAAGPTLYTPAYDGCDRYSATAGNVVGNYPSRAPLISVPGYVVDHTLVAQLPQLGLPLGEVTVTITSATFSAKLAPDGTAFRLNDGVLAGRMKFDQLVDFVGRTEVGDPLAPICQSSFWPVVSPTLCAGRDTMLSPNDEFHGNVCDAVTISTGFTARTVQVSDEEYDPVVSGDCAGITVDCP